MSPTTSTIKELGEAVVTVSNSDIAKLETLQERQTPLKVPSDRRGPQNSDKVLEERIQIHIMEHTRKTKADKKMKHQRRERGSGVSSSRSKILGAILK